MKKELSIFDNPKNVKRLLICFYCSLVILLISEFFIHPHPAFFFENIKGFSAVYGFFLLCTSDFPGQNFKINRDEKRELL